MNASNEFWPRIFIRRMPLFDLGEDLKSLLSTAGLSPKTNWFIELRVKPAMRSPSLGSLPQQSKAAFASAACTLVALFSSLNLQLMLRE
jgi:hypothetical protein